MADTPAQAALREAFNSKLSVIPQTLSQEQQTQAQTNIGGPFLPLSGGTVSGTIAATGFSGPLAGNASTASKWATARKITLEGGATGSVSFDGSADATLKLTIANGSVTNEKIKAGTIAFDRLASAAIATREQAIAGILNNVLMTPEMVAAAINALVPPAVPTGMVAYFALTAIPEGWLLCNGANVSRTTYAALFTAIGTKFGSGDGATTFTLPNLNERFIEGTTTTSDVGKKLEAGLPNIRGRTGIGWNSGLATTDIGQTGSFKVARVVDRTASPGGIGDWNYHLDFDASKSNSIFGMGSTVQPKSIQLLPCIKF